jgi:hypothetical protein
VRLAVHVGRLVTDLVRFSVARRHVALLVVILVAIAVVGLVIASQAAAPFVLYPFV